MAMLRVVKAHPELLTDDGEKPRGLIAYSYAETNHNLVALVIALVVALAVPALQYYSLLLLAVPSDMLRARLRSR
jgi:hypothetical protein